MKKILFIIYYSLFIITAAWAQEVSFTVSAPRVVATGEAFRVSFSLNEEPDNYTGPDFGGLNVLAGPSRSSSQSIQIINGKTSHSKTVSFVYVLQAGKEGSVSIGSAKATVNGKQYQTQGFNIDVVSSDAVPATNNQQQQQGQSGAAASRADETDAFVSISLSKGSVYRGEHVIATIKLYTRQMNIAGFEEVKFPSFNGFWSQEVESAQQLQFQRENVNGKLYNAAVLRRYVLYPQQTGSIKIDPFEVTCVLQVRGNTQARSIFDSFFDTPQSIRKHIVSASPSLQVNELPAGAPASFKGAVGSNFQLDAHFNRDSVQANDAINLLVKISGEGNLKLMEAPDVNFPPHFEVYDIKTTDNSKVSAAGISGSKTFEYPIIPRSEGSFDIPAVEFSYFDIQKKQYVSLRSKGLHLGASKDPNAGSATTVASLNRQSVKSLGSDIRYIKTGTLKLSEAGQLFFCSAAYWLLLALLCASFICIYVWLKQHIKKSQDKVFTRHRKANKMARRRLKAAGVFLKDGNGNAFYDELSRALWGYLTDKTGLEVADLSREKAREAMREKQAQEEDIEAYLHVIEDCEFARYAPGSGRSEMQKVYDEAIRMISKLEQVF